MKTFWLSFTDPDRPEGDQFLGVAVIDVTDEDAARAKEQLASKFPQAKPGAEWIAAATQLAWAHGCNPGGEVLSVEVTDDPEVELIPRSALMLREELNALHLI